MDNRGMLDKYKELICFKLNEMEEKHGAYWVTPESLVSIGEALEKYIWMDAEIKDNEKDNEKGE